MYARRQTNTGAHIYTHTRPRTQLRRYLIILQSEEKEEQNQNNI